MEPTTFTLTTLQPEDRAVIELWQGATLPPGDEIEITVPADHLDAWHRLLLVLNIRREGV
jgi:hypothetical protein